MLRAEVQAGITLLALPFVPVNAASLVAQRFMRAVHGALPAVVAAAHRPRVVAIFTAQVTSLQEQRQAAARPVHTGERDNLTD
ncbi:hypothetical protein HMPREF0880_00511 [Yokenella regensburgei ATCC 43003]|nr:hypothetical protein HMPREF0880_00511 [Yokenella regensburgei ATCC 43003]